MKMIPYLHFPNCAVCSIINFSRVTTFQYRNCDVNFPIMHIFFLFLQSLFLQIQFSDSSQFAVRERYYAKFDIRVSVPSIQFKIRSLSN